MTTPRHCEETGPRGTSEHKREAGVAFKGLPVPWLDHIKVEGRTLVVKDGGSIGRILPGFTTTGERLNTAAKASLRNRGPNTRLQ